MIKNNISAILFDLDGTLVDTRSRFYLVFNKSLEKFNLPTVSRKVFDNLYTNASLEKVVADDLKIQFWDYFLEDYSNISSPDEFMIPGSKQALYELKKRGMSIGIVTGRIASVKSVWRELKKYELDQFIDVVFTRLKSQNRNEYYFSKEQNLLEALDTLGYKPFESMFVGDHIGDIISGKRIGAVTIAVLSGGVKKEILARENPDLIIESVAKLPSIISDSETD
nr:HAD family hydrolase [Candidatus Freyarchaeota archaeon]